MEEDGFGILLVMLLVLGAMAGMAMSIVMIYDLNIKNERLTEQLNTKEIIYIDREVVATTTVESLCDTTEIEAELERCYSSAGVDYSLYNMCESKIKDMEKTSFSLLQSRDECRKHEGELLKELTDTKLRCPF